MAESEAATLPVQVKGGARADVRWLGHHGCQLSNLQGHSGVCSVFLASFAPDVAFIVVKEACSSYPALLIERRSVNPSPPLLNLSAAFLRAFACTRQEKP